MPAIDAPIVRGLEIPAYSLPDHRLAYLEYEGAVSNDRGHVTRVDEGVYEPLEWTSERVVGRLMGTHHVGLFELREVATGSEESTGSGNDSNSGGEVGRSKRNLGLGRETRSRWTFRLGNFD